MTSNTFLLFGIMTVLISCNGQHQKAFNDKTALAQSTAIGHRIPEIGKNIRCIFQDSKNNYWYGSDGDGVYRYDGKNLVLFTDKDGLCHNQVLSIQEDQLGNIWFGTGNGISRFDGHTFTTFTKQSNSNIDQGWTIGADDLWFAAENGVYRYDGHVLNYLQFPNANDSGRSNAINPYDIYCVYKDRKGNIWFGTESKGVCRYDGKSFTWFTEKGLGSAAVRSIFEDKDGNFWFGHSGFGLFRYDGKNLANFTKENGPGNADFVNALKDKTVSVLAINDDEDGNMWIGTYDTGLWRYDGQKTTGYTIKDGLPGNAFFAIYKDKKGELWFGSGEGVFKFNGQYFSKFEIAS